MKVKDYMTENVVWANLQDGLFQTYERMHERSIRHMPVLDGKENLVGIITDRDLRRPDWMDQDPDVAYPFILDNRVAVEQVMTEDPKRVGIDDELASVLDLLLEKRYGALPVVDGTGKLVGMISTIDVLQAFKDHLNQLV